MIYAIITAGGVGQRMNQSVPKQFMTIYDKPLIIYTLEQFEKHPMIDKIVISCLEGWSEVLLSYAKQYKIRKLYKVVTGGVNGQQSIFNGLNAIKDEATKDDIVLIHDGNRPNVGMDIISDAINVCKKHGNAIPVIPCQEVMIEIENPNDQSSNKQIERSLMKRTQTPHAIYFSELYNMHLKAQEKGITNSVATCSLIMEMGKKVYLSIGSEKNLKITTQDDLDIFKALLKLKESSKL